MKLLDGYKRDESTVQAEHSKSAQTKDLFFYVKDRCLSKVEVHFISN
jgi:hypothetical protein